jgi:membrane-associated protein
MPIPDEAVVMTGGFVSSLRILRPVPSFLITYLGVISGLSLGYTVGRVWGADVHDRLGKKEKWKKYLIRSEFLIGRYGSYALCISYFLPVVRHLLPYLAGSYRMPFFEYALFSYSTALIWTGIYYWIGYQFGSSIETVAQLSQEWGATALALLVVLLVVFWYVHEKKRSKENDYESSTCDSHCGR